MRRGWCCHCGEGACSRWTAQQSHSFEAKGGGRFAAQREQAPSPQVVCGACLSAKLPVCVGLA
ncbi:DUF2180 family protein [Pseudomonas fluorescens]|nr:DUF2180 family protein [Pseudomonas fluorescens]MBD8089973.1 DUF2180 family protein [Pseudomonas fluorescens]MBD8717017.1 DUF2180 family protein [Pseudomonas fluorescens]